jgi:hypothetical protein
MTRDQELLYWQTLARDRGRQLEALRSRVLLFLESAPDATVAALARSLSDADAPVVDADYLATTPELHAVDVLSMLDDLWRRVADH